ncbi:dual specificity catalytic domain-containing protein [Cystoisospora suis]|uniref:protein-tyrosine-phosphatase n=1 Tax=Cystoisospora suis TaxID=483139 RepID=A0A2C6L3P7_9APIC|nr:dual specificity catalytic domain-containing protein [Cystoisospora suis]
MALVTPSAGPAFSFFAHFSPLSGQQRLAAHQILPHLFLGSAAAARSAAWLHEHHITHILCIHNAAATPRELKQQLRTAFQRREHHKQEAVRSATRQSQSVAEQLVVHGDRCVYCCCYVQDTPHHLLLGVLSPALRFVDNAIQNQSFRGGGPPQAEGDHTVLPVRNHLFIADDEQMSFYEHGESEPDSRGRDEKNGHVPPAKCRTALAHGNVLVHCAKGISRSASFVICYLMYRRCWSYNDSFTYIRRKRPIYPNVGFQIQLQLIQCLLEKFRPTIPRVDNEDDSNRKRVTAAAVAAGLVRDEDEPDLFRRDPAAPEKLLRILADARTALNTSSLETKLVESILTQLLAVQELVQSMFKQTGLLRDRQKWEPLGLFFENLKSYTVPAAPEVLKTAEKVAKKASELKLVFTATLPGVAIADTVADEIRRWIQVASQNQTTGKETKDEKEEHKHFGRGRTAAALETLTDLGEVPGENSRERNGEGGRRGTERLSSENPANVEIDESPLAGTIGVLGSRTASTAATLRERLQRLREKREQLTAKEAPDTGPAADQASSGHRDGSIDNTRVSHTASREDHRVTRERDSVLSADENEQRHRKELKKRRKKEKKERKKMKKRLKRASRKGGLSESDDDSSECSRNSRARSHREPGGGRGHLTCKQSSESSSSPPRGRKTFTVSSDRNGRTRKEDCGSSEAQRRPSPSPASPASRPARYGRRRSCEVPVSPSYQKRRGRANSRSCSREPRTIEGMVSEKPSTCCSSAVLSCPSLSCKPRSPVNLHSRSPLSRRSRSSRSRLSRSPRSRRSRSPRSRHFRLPGSRPSHPCSPGRRRHEDQRQRSKSPPCGDRSSSLSGSSRRSVPADCESRSTHDFTHEPRPRSRSVSYSPPLKDKPSITHRRKSGSWERESLEGGAAYTRL